MTRFTIILDLFFGEKKSPITTSTTTTRTTTLEFEPCEAADVVLVVDTSGSIKDKGEGNWNITLNFIKAMTVRLGISKTGNHIGMVSFSNNARIEFAFLSDEEEVLKRVPEINYEGGFTNTPAAFKLARETLLTGTYGARPQSQDIIILITDGNTTVDVALLPEEIRLMKETGARILAIGVTNSTNEQQLMTIVSQPQYYHRVENFAGLMSNLDNIIQNTGNCEEITQRPEPKGNANWFSLPHSNNSLFSLTVQVCNADIVFLIDGSGSIEDKGKENWGIVKSFLLNLVDRIVLGKNANHLAAVTFSNTARTEFTFSFDEVSIKQQINVLNYEGGFTNTTGGFRHIRQNFFNNNPDSGDRSGSQNIIVLITDGNTTKEAADVIPEANRNKNNGAIIMAIGVTDDIDEVQLLAIVTNQKYYHRVEDFDGLLSDLGSILVSSDCEVSGVNTGRK